VTSRTFAGKRPLGASTSKAKSFGLSQLSGLKNVLFNDFIDDEPDSEDVSEQRVSASLPDSVPIESEEERAAREEVEMAALCLCVCVCVCVCARARRRYVFVNLYLHFLNFVFVCVQQGRHIAH
jgi:hypothetical protein